jgi:hypothetical protein
MIGIHSGEFLKDVEISDAIRRACRLEAAVQAAIGLVSAENGSLVARASSTCMTLRGDQAAGR